MASSLLQCSICPKLPTFSDVSHLLTHVGSKGHLAHLHKLQVKSHQDLTAAHQLANYNIWYQHHGLSRLLSDRMQQKIAKPTVKRERQTKQQQKKTLIKSDSPSPVSGLLDPSLRGVSFATGVGQNRTRRRNSYHVKQLPASDQDSDYQVTPVRKTRKHTLRNEVPRPVKRQSFHDSDLDCPAEDDPGYQATPEHARLKGKVWPGMALFDAAPEEIRKTRNQRKDSSVLRGMERTSESIEPTEVIYSTLGEMLKERYIDGEVDDEDLLLEQTPVPKLPVRRRRQPLASISGNTSRAGRRSTKVKGRTRSPKAKPLPPPVSERHSQITSSPSKRTSVDTPLHYSPTPEERLEFKRAVGNLTTKKRVTGFTVFKDGRNNQPSYTLPVQPAYNDTPVKNPFIAHQNVSGLQQLSFVTAPWLQPQHQQNLLSDYRYFSADTAPKPLPIRGHGKEDIPWMSADNHDAGRAQANPLGWALDPQPQPLTYISGGQHSYLGYGDFGGFGHIDDPFASRRNPLSLATGQFDGTHESATLPRTPNKRPVSPDGTEPETEAAHYDQSIFTTSE